MLWFRKRSPGYPINFFFPDCSGIFQDNNAKIHWALVVKKWSMRTHECQGAWGVIFAHECAKTESWLYPIKSLWDVLEKTEGMVQSSIPNLGQKLVQLWMEINVVTLHKVVETTPQQMRSIIKERATFILDRQCIFICYPQICDIIKKLHNGQILHCWLARHTENNILNLEMTFFKYYFLKQTDTRNALLGK